MKRLVLILAITALFAACNEESELRKADSMTVSTNSEYNISKGVYLKTRSVIDMRKPIGSKMDWKGDAKLRLQVYTGKRTVDTLVSTIFPNEIVVDGYRIKLLSVYPYPELNKTRNQKDYSIQLSLEKVK
jgi:hypothetical protein